MTTTVLNKLTPLPDIEKFKSTIKKDFEQRYRHLLGNNYDDFINYSLSYLNKSIRVNTLKIAVAELKERLQQHDLLGKPKSAAADWAQSQQRLGGQSKN